MFFVYVLFSNKDRKLYIGSTKNLEQRMKDHSSGKVPSTCAQRPLELIYYEAYLYKKEAVRREKFLKGGKGRGELKKQLMQTLKVFEYKHL